MNEGRRIEPMKSSSRRIRIPALACLLLAAAPVFAQEVPDFGKLAGFIRWGGVALSGLVVLATMVLQRIVTDLGSRLSAKFANRRPTIQKVESAVHFLFYVSAAGACLTLSVRLDSTALTVIGGALAFSIGFAMRDLVAAFIAGITIMFDRPFQVGDRVTYGGEYGDIIKIGVRSVQMNTLDHNIVTIPNNKILTDVTSSGNYGELEMQVPMDFYIGLDQNAELAREIIREACLTSTYVFLDRPIPVFIKQVILQDYLAVNLKARPYVFDCRYEKPFETDVHFRVLKAFSENGIHPPAILHRGVIAQEGPRAPMRRMRASEVAEK
jgi:small-conductance mechanosensitive channel